MAQRDLFGCKPFCGKKNSKEAAKTQNSTQLTKIKTQKPEKLQTSEYYGFHENY